MPDDLTKKKPQDSSRINLNEKYEVNWWTDALGCTEAQLRAAVNAVGDSAAAVRAHLKK